MATGQTIYNTSFPSPYQVPTAPLTSSNIKPTGSANGSTAPVNNADTSGFQQQMAALQAQVQQMQGQVQQYQQQQADQKKQQSTQTQQPAQQPSVLDKLLQNTQQTNQQLQQSQQNTTQQVQQAEQQTPEQKAISDNEAAIASAGYTKEAYQNMVDMSAKMTAVQAQITDLDNKYTTDVQNAQSQPGQTQDESAAAVAGITRTYQAQKANLTSQGNLLGLQAAAASNNYNAAASAAADYVKNATYQQAQVVSDLKWGAEQYNSIISNMSSQNQALVQFMIGEQDKELTRQQSELDTKLGYAVSTGLNLSADQMKNMTQDEVASAAAQKHNQQVELDQAQQRAQIYSTNALTSERSQATTSAKAIKASISGYPKAVTIKGGFMGWGGGQKFEYVDPSTGYKYQADTLEDAQNKQNALVQNALNLSQSGLNYSQTVNIGGTDYTVGQQISNGKVTLTATANGNWSGSDGNIYDGNGNIIK